MAERKPLIKKDSAFLGRFPSNPQPHFLSHENFSLQSSTSRSINETPPGGETFVLLFVILLKSRAKYQLKQGKIAATLIQADRQPRPIAPAHTSTDQPCQTDREVPRQLSTPTAPKMAHQLAARHRSPNCSSSELLGAVLVTGSWPYSDWHVACASQLESGRRHGRVTRDGTVERPDGTAERPDATAHNGSRLGRGASEPDSRGSA